MTEHTPSRYGRAADETVYALLSETECEEGTTTGEVIRRLVLAFLESSPTPRGAATAAPGLTPS